jgi:hypothetical protein
MQKNCDRTKISVSSIHHVAIDFVLALVAIELCVRWAPLDANEAAAGCAKCSLSLVAVICIYLFKRRACVPQASRRHAAPLQVPLTPASRNGPHAHALSTSQTHTGCFRFGVCVSLRFSNELGSDANPLSL